MIQAGGPEWTPPDSNLLLLFRASGERRQYADVARVVLNDHLGLVIHGDRSIDASVSARLTLNQGTPLLFSSFN